MKKYFESVFKIFDTTMVENLWKLSLIIVVSIVFAYILRAILNKISQILSEKHKDPVWIDALSTPFVILIFIVSFFSLFKATLIFKDSFDQGFLVTIKNFGVVLCIWWFAIRYSVLLQQKYLKSSGSKKLDKGAVDSLGKLFNVIITVVVVLLSMDILGFDIRGLLTFAGVSGIAVAFASKELLSNFFGTIIIYFDKPFVVGDFIKISDGKEGTVEYIGWRMTKLRSVDKVPIYIPNSVFSSDVIENYTRRTHRMMRSIVGIRYDDVHVLEKIINDVKTYLDKHKSVSSDQPIIVGFDGFADSSVNFLVRVCLIISDYKTFYDIKTELMMHVYQIVKKHKADIAFPTRTILGEIKYDMINKKGKL